MPTGPSDTSHTYPSVSFEVDLPMSRELNSFQPSLHSHVLSTSDTSHLANSIRTLFPDYSDFFVPHVSSQMPSDVRYTVDCDKS